MRAVLPDVVERDALLEMCTRRRKVSEPEQGVTYDIVGDQEEGRILDPPGQGEKLLPQRAGSLVVRPQFVELPESAQDGDELGRLPHLLTQLACPGVRPTHLGGGKALGGSQRHAQGDLQREFLLGASGSVGQRLQQLQALAEVTDRFHVRRSLDGSFPGVQPVRQGLFHETRLGVVMRQQLGLSVFGFGKALFQRPGDLLVILLPLALEQRLIGCILDQRMLKTYRACGGNPRW